MYSCSDLNKKRTLVGKEFKTESGLIYTITHEGNGVRAKAGDQVVMHYTGKLTNDSIFDSSIFRAEPFVFKLGVGQVLCQFSIHLLSSLHITKFHQISF